LTRIAGQAVRLAFSVRELAANAKQSRKVVDAKMNCASRHRSPFGASQAAYAGLVFARLALMVADQHGVAADLAVAATQE
jgi:hypothetical protein